MCGCMFKYGLGINSHTSACKKKSKSNNQILCNFLIQLTFFFYNVYFLLLIIYNQINLYILSRTACLEINQFFMFCNSGLLSKTDIFIVHTSSYKNFYEFCTMSRITCLKLIVIQKFQYSSNENILFFLILVQSM
jgi:hypothetical protein